MKNSSLIKIMVFVFIGMNLGCHSTNSSNPSNTSKPDQSALGGTSSGGPPAQWVEQCANAGATEIQVSGGQTSGFLCQFSFAQIDELTLYKAITNGAASQQATNAFESSNGGTSSYPNAAPTAATSYCQSVGGSLKRSTVTFRPDNSVDMCVFPDGSQIEEWTLFWGPRFGADLANILPQ